MLDLHTLETSILQYAANPATTQDPIPLPQVLNAFLHYLEAGEIAVATKSSSGWKTHTWVKQGILLLFKHSENKNIECGFSQAYDKIPLQFTSCASSLFKERKLRIVPPASIRRGAYIGPNTVIMPSFINIGANIGAGTMVDTWATVGSCAQIGKNVHLSGGVGIGGVLEPLQADPVIIEDNCFIGARSEIVEGVIVEENSVIGMGVFLGQSTKIYDRATKTVSYGRIPAGSVVVPGSLPDSTGTCQLACAVIVKQVDAKTRAKTSINALLRDTEE